MTSRPAGEENTVTTIVTGLAPGERGEAPTRLGACSPVPVLTAARPTKTDHTVETRLTPRRPHHEN